MQCYQTDMETEKVRSNFVRMQEERDRLILEGDDHADHLTRKHELKLRYGNVFRPNRCACEPNSPSEAHFSFRGRILNNNI